MFIKKNRETRLTHFKLTPIKNKKQDFKIYLYIPVIFTVSYESLVRITGYIDLVE